MIFAVFNLTILVSFQIFDIKKNALSLNKTARICFKKSLIPLKKFHTKKIFAGTTVNYS
jgi:hypothetical protein